MHTHTSEHKGLQTHTKGTQSHLPTLRRIIGFIFWRIFMVYSVTKYKWYWNERESLQINGSCTTIWCWFDRRKIPLLAMKRMIMKVKIYLRTKQMSCDALRWNNREGKYCCPAPAWDPPAEVAKTSCLDTSHAHGKESDVIQWFYSSSFPSLKSSKIKPFKF